jgi:hypothetical protein
MEASPEVQRALATIQAVIEDLTPEAPLAVDQPSTSEVEEARRALSVLRNFLGWMSSHNFCLRPFNGRAHDPSPSQEAERFGA